MLAATSFTRHVVMLGDFNLDWHRSLDSGYGPCPLLLHFGNVSKTRGLRHLPTAATFRSHGLFPTATGPPAPRVSCIDHIYTTEDWSASVLVLPDATTDHRPVLAEIATKAKESSGSKTINRRKTKDLLCVDINRALNKTSDWGAIHHIRDVDDIHSLLVGGVNKV
jgi:hypothetical protein